MAIYTIRQAHGEEDLQAVIDLWNEAQAWLRERGSDQWQYPVRVDNIQASMCKYHVWVVEAGEGRHVATVTIDDDADRTLWQSRDCPNTALYIHRLVVSRQGPYSGLGSVILDWCEAVAAFSGKRLIRVDAWTSNSLLHNYYLSHGFHHVRTVDAPSIHSGALFERAVEAEAPPAIPNGLYLSA